MNDKMIEKIY